MISNSVASKTKSQLRQNIKLVMQSMLNDIWSRIENNICTKNMLTLILSSLPINSVKTLLTSSFVFVFLKSLLGFWSPCYKTNKIQCCTEYTKRFVWTQGSYKKLQPFWRAFHGFFKDHIRFSRTTYQECNIISPIVQKCIFSTLPVNSHRVLSLELFPPPTSLYFSVHLSLLHKTKNSLCKLALTSLSYHLYSVLHNQKALKTPPQAPTFNVEENSRTFQGLPLKFKYFSRLCEPWNNTIMHTWIKVLKTISSSKT